MGVGDGAVVVLPLLQAAAANRNAETHSPCNVSDVLSERPIGFCFTVTMSVLDQSWRASTVRGLEMPLTPRGG
jgi:hypothetical protein